MKPDNQKAALKENAEKETWVSKPRRTHTKEFKLEAVRLARERGNVLKTAQELGISRNLLYAWMYAAGTVREDSPDLFRGHGNQTESEREITELRRKLRVAEEERDILKKAAQWFAKESR